jgi:hypothetical protein
MPHFGEGELPPSGALDVDRVLGFGAQPG